MVTGPTGSGKSTFVFKLISHLNAQKIYYFYGAWQAEFKKHKNIKFIEGLPTKEFKLNPKFKNVVVIDDLISDAKSSKIVSDLFTKYSHHCRATIILVSQNLFIQGSAMRSVSLNTQYFVLFKNPRDCQQIQYLGRQIYGSNWQFLEQAYNDATKNKAHSYLVIDLKQGTPESERLKTHVLGEKKSVTFYKPCG